MRSISSRVANAGAAARPSAESRPESSGSSGVSVARGQQIGSGDGVPCSRPSSDIPVPFAELEPISENAHAVAVDNSKAGYKNNEVGVL